MVTDIDAYYIMLRDFDLNKRISTTQVLFLKYIAESPFLNAYQLDKKQRGTPFEVAYVNVRKQLLDLEEKQLVEKVPVDESLSKHKANFYRLTGIGIHYLFSRYKEGSVLPVDLQLVIGNYRDNLLVRMFIRDWFEEETIQRITPNLNFLLTNYMQQMTMVAEDSVVRIRQLESKSPKVEFYYTLSEFAVIEMLGIMFRAYWMPKMLVILREDRKFRGKVSEMRADIDKLFSSILGS